MMRSWISSAWLPSLCVGAAILTAGTARAQTPCTWAPGGTPGTPECGFGPAHVGLVTTVLSGDSGGTDVVRRSDGKLLVAANERISAKGKTSGTRPRVLRYNADGSLDDGGPLDTTPGDTFGAGGVAAFSFTSQVAYEGANALALQPGTSGEPRIVVAGATNNASGSFGIARLTADGVLDTTFGGGTGRVAIAVGRSATANDVVVQPDRRIVLVGTTDSSILVVRLLENGALDPSFGSGGKLLISAGSGVGGANSVALQTMPLGPECAADPTGAPRIVVGGSATISSKSSARNMLIARVCGNGVLDTSFDGDGRVFVDIQFVDYLYDLAVDATNRIVVTGPSGMTVSGAGDVAVARLLPRGVLDPSFGGMGWVLTDMSGTVSPECVVFDSAGRVLVAGTQASDDWTTQSFMAVRYVETGELDTSFGSGGLSIVDFAPASGEYARGAVLDDSGRLVIVGQGPAADPQAVAVTALNP